jgi:uncharacterized protein (TIGR02246 family)
MIRFTKLFAIGAVLMSSLTASSFGQIVRRRPSVPAQAQPAQVRAVAGAQTVQAQPAGAVAGAAQPMTADEKSVREAITAYVAAYNQRDAAKLVEHFTADSTLVDSDNVVTRGREAIAREFSAAFAEPSTYTLEGKIDRVRVITADVAQVEGDSRLVAPREATLASRFVALLARQGNAWKIVELRDFPSPTESVTPYERLKELEWMVGDWVDESGDAKVSSTVQWGQGKAYLVRNYSVQVKGKPASSGLMIIAWEPQTEQIKSWVFNAEGSRGEGSWTRASSNQWVVKVNGTTLDGRPNSATQLITLVNKDAVKTSSVDRIVGGEIAPDIDEVIMVRKPPAPGSAPASTSGSTAAPSPSGR